MLASTVTFTDVLLLIWGKIIFSGGLKDAESMLLLCSHQISIDGIQMLRNGVRTEKMRGVFS